MKRVLYMLWHHWKNFLAHPWEPKYLVAIMITNILGSAYGYYWYAGQLAATQVKLWPFVPDSPLSTTMFSVVLILSLLGRNSPFFSALAYTGCIKYGLWAVIIISDYWIGGGPVEYKVAMLWVSHLGMAAQGAVYLRTINSQFNKHFSGPSLSGAAVAGVATWMVLNDFLDYRLGIYPYLYLQRQEGLAAFSAVSLSGVLLVLLVYMWSAKVPNNNR